MLVSRNFLRFSKSIRFATNAGVSLKNDSQSRACLHTLRSKLEKLCITDSGCNFNGSVGRTLRYSTKAEEIPELPPPPPREADVFGTMGGMKYQTVELSEDERKEEERLKTLGGRVPRKFKPSAGQYADMIKTYLTKGDIEAAAGVIEQCRKNHDKPTEYMFTLLIRGFAEQGDVKNSYRYYSQLKTMHYKVKANTYTSLFNAIANSADTEKALHYLERVRKYMIAQKAPMNHVHYNVLAKAYGRHHKYDEALKLLQEMMDKKMKIGITTLNSMMFAANSYNDCGLKYVLHLWQLMRKLKVPPDMFTYHLVFRAIRDTQFGNCTIHELYLPNTRYPAIVIDDNRPDLLMYPPIISSLPLDNVHRNEPEKVLLEAPTSESESSESLELTENSSESAISKDGYVTLPPEITNLNLDAVLAKNKLILFGGLEGIIEKMKKDRIKPNVKTVTYLVELVPDSIAAENEVIKYARAEGLQFDIDFFNMLIKKRALRGAKKEAKAVLDEIVKSDLRPNIVTYGCLALACDTSRETRELVQTVKETGLALNKYIAGALIKNACYRRDFHMILELMEKIKYERIRIDETIYEILDGFQKKLTELIKMKNPAARTEHFKTGFAKFNLRYKTWQQDMKRQVMTERVDKPKK